VSSADAHVQQATIQQLLDGTTNKPWTFRRLVPQIANFADRELPASAKEKFATFMQDHFLDNRSLAPETFYAKVTNDTPEYHFRYMVVYYIGFAGALAALFLLRLICRDLGTGEAAAVLAPTAVMLAFPFLETHGGYFYDYTELFFLSLLFLLALRAKPVLMIAVACVATLNKESVFFFLPTLYPILRLHMGRKFSAISAAAATFASGLVYLAEHYSLRDAPDTGTSVMMHLWLNLNNYVTLWRYHQLEATYGIIGPSGAFPVTLILIALIIWRGWADCPERVRQNFKIAAVINLPLFIAFCSTGELRNLSLMFVAFVVLSAGVIRANLEGRTQVLRVRSVGPRPD
jgi:hypothetical protein